jgi:hypothetical protein
MTRTSMGALFHHFTAFRLSAVGSNPNRRNRTRVIDAVMGALLVGCLAGCGASHTYLNGLTVERSIAQSFLAQRDVYTRVFCPSRIPQQKGHLFQCNARFDVGSYTIPVTEVDGKGHVHWSTRAPVKLLDVKQVMSAISRSVLRQRGVRSTVTCPPQVLQREGLTFTCTAAVRSGTSKVKPGPYPFRVTEADAAGHVTYVGV